MLRCKVSMALGWQLHREEITEAYFYDLHHDLVCTRRPHVWRYKKLSVHAWDPKNKD